VKAIRVEARIAGRLRLARVPGLAALCPSTSKTIHPSRTFCKPKIRWSSVASNSSSGLISA